ncbi:unnamed protein product [Durusdinium trenchii]|uniref:AAA+ ATPase domain-containing protein n=1 Tax=Durusdinium trenchii TaxID=1381693 RepID=A0ABP0S8U2_9DINO
MQQISSLWTKSFSQKMPASLSLEERWESKHLPMCQSALHGLQLLLGGCFGEEEEQAPEIYQARYVRLRRNQPLPPFLEKVVSSTSGREICQTQAFRRSRRRFPRHLLHGTLQSLRGLDEAVYYFQVDDKAVVQTAFAFWRLKEELEGPEGHCHGGCLAAVLDDAFGSFSNTHLRSLGRSGAAMTAYLHVDYKAPTPLPSECVCIVELDRVEGRKVFLKGKMLIKKGDELQKTCDSTCLDLHDIELRSRNLQFECREVVSGGDSEVNRLSLLIDFGGLVASLAALWYLFKTNTQNSFTAKHLEEGKDLSRQPSVTFADVAGMEGTKEELQEVIAYLRDPDRFYALGARPPRGILLAGPSGTGKTLMARAVAGEAGVPFLYASSASFVEIFVGQGASRIRQFFEQARACAPCIVFLDELDAVGSSRQMSASGGGNQEYAQTLNQLLLELDGVESNANGAPVVVTMAATNRYHCLDEALVRPGRLDRIVMVNLPNQAERVATLQIHAAKLRTENLDLALLARRTEGMSGADLANLLNEAALLAARRRADAVRMDHIWDVLGNPRPKQQGSTTSWSDDTPGAGAGFSDAQEQCARLLAAFAAAVGSRSSPSGGCRG